MCKTYLNTKEDLDAHLKTKEHYDVFATDVTERKERVAAAEESRKVKATEICQVRLYYVHACRCCPHFRTREDEIVL
jgi:hypothetical protein